MSKQVYEDSPRKLSNYDRLIQDFKTLEGRILTIIDASFTKGEQCNAVKSLISQELSYRKYELGRRMGLIVDGSKN